MNILFYLLSSTAERDRFISLRTFFQQYFLIKQCYTHLPVAGYASTVLVWNYCSLIYECSLPWLQGCSALALRGYPIPPHSGSQVYRVNICRIHTAVLCYFLSFFPSFSFLIVVDLLSKNLQGECPNPMLINNKEARAFEGGVLEVKED